MTEERSHSGAGPATVSGTFLITTLFPQFILFKRKQLLERRR